MSSAMTIPVISSIASVVSLKYLYSHQYVDTAFVIPAKAGIQRLLWIPGLRRFAPSPGMTAQTRPVIYETLHSRAFREFI